MAPWILVLTPALALALNCLAFLALRRGLGIRLAIAIAGGLACGLAAIITMTLASLRQEVIDRWDLGITQVGTYLALSFCF